MTRNDVIRSNAAHIRRVGELLVKVANELSLRAVNHDASKWSEEEFPYIEILVPKMVGVVYDSPEYKAALKEVKPATEHHNRVNSHHPEFYKDGINGMSLLDLMELLCDWKAAGERNVNGNMAQSLEVNKTRFKIEPQLLMILENTCREQGWIPAKTEPSPTPGYAGREEFGGHDLLP